MTKSEYCLQESNLWSTEKRINFVVVVVVVVVFHRKSRQRSEEKSLRTRAVQKGTTTSHYLVLALKKIWTRESSLVLQMFSRHHGSRFFVLHPNHLFSTCLNVILYFWYKFLSGLKANDVATGSWTASKTRCFWAGRRSTKTGNRPFSRSKNSHFSNGEAKCKTFLWKMSVICKKMQNPFHFNCFELSLVLKQRLGATLNGLFFCELTMLLRTPSSALAMSSYGAFWW